MKHIAYSCDWCGVRADAPDTPSIGDLLPKGWSYAPMFARAHIISEVICPQCSECCMGAVKSVRAERLALRGVKAEP